MCLLERAAHGLSERPECQAGVERPAHADVVSRSHLWIGQPEWELHPLADFVLEQESTELEIFVAALQAFIFAVLSASYIGQAKAESH